MSPNMKLCHQSQYVVCNAVLLKDVSQISWLLAGDSAVSDTFSELSQNFYEDLVSKKAAELKGMPLFTSGPKFV